MNEALLNNELAVSYPDGFHVMDEEDLKRVFLDAAPDRWGIWDRERHVIIALQWHESHPAFLRKIVSAKDLAKRAEAATHKAYKQMGYLGGSLFERNLCGEEAWGYRFESVVQGAPQVGEVDVFLRARERGNCAYTAYFQASRENAAAHYALFEEFLASMRFA